MRNGAHAIDCHRIQNMSFLEINGVQKHFGQSVAVERFDLKVERGEFISFLGPSGCGKTTTLRMIAGFEQPSAGQILIDQALPDDEMRLISATLDDFAAREGVGFHALRARRSGTKRHVDMHMVVDPDTTVREGHVLTGRVKTAVQRALPGSEVLIHLEDHD